MKLTKCDRCGHTEEEDDFSGSCVNIFTQEGMGVTDGEFTLCDPCVSAYRRWIAEGVPQPMIERAANSSGDSHGR